MEPDPKHGTVIADLQALGRSVSLPTPADRAADDRAADDRAADDRVAAVMARLADAPPPRPAAGWQLLGLRPAQSARRRYRAVMIAVAVVLLGCLGVPGVRAAVVDWFGFAGVGVRIDPGSGSSEGATPTQASPPPTANASITLDGARALVRFRPMVPTELGPPDAVEVSPDHRLLSLTWNGPGRAITRLDEFDGGLDYAFAKTAAGVEWTTVAGQTALWFEQPHAVVVLDAAGNPRTEAARLAGHTLIWEQAGTVLRLEGDLSRERAVEVAESAQPMP